MQRVSTAYNFEAGLRDVDHQMVSFAPKGFSIEEAWERSDLLGGDNPIENINSNQSRVRVENSLLGLTDGISATAQEEGREGQDKGV
ncbi:hypothetical protein JVT61DRAFT_2901 [Boletus reticuloceps]|uniref:Uncharacterized protein n=1 Tax=Boletus reticuloceps TaxID=495285 RepID=A0A8I2YPX9_9AGAM|nr:hypothetical protein JVT61DRAFT_2901 [Boletus reticuloceps]